MSKTSYPARKRRLAIHAWLACAALAASTLRAQGLEAAFTTPGDIPVTAASYTASGEATFTLSFAPTPGTNLTVVKNTGLPFIEGQFTNLPNGSTVTLTHNGTTYPFIAWYYGGDGNNDLVLLWPYTGLAAWGENNAGQLGNKDTIGSAVPIAVSQFGALMGKTIVQVARGGAHSLALCSDGTVTAWGDNSNGQIGDSSTTNRYVPVMVNIEAGTSALAGKTVVAIAAGIAHSLALCSDGTVVAWGLNRYSQLGDNSLTNRSVPVAVNVAAGASALSGKTVVTISAGSEHSLALCSDGTVVSWGWNFSGQLGDTSTTNRLVPVAVNVAAGTSTLAGKSVASISAGGYHSLALCSDGTLAAWGDNYYGQLGDNSTTRRTVPVAVNAAAGTSALSGKSVVAISAGHSHTLALCSDGTVAAWGWNSSGQLGDNSEINRQVPVAVHMTSALFGKTVIAITAGYQHSLALCHDGTMAAWGDNRVGQLGDGSFWIRLVPVLVNQVSAGSALADKQISGVSVGGVGNHSSVIYSGTLPEIEVEVLEPSVTALTHEVSTVDFGTTVAVGRTFRVRNTGGLPLGNVSVSITGADAGSFTVLRQPSSFIEDGMPSTFLVALTGGSLGPKSAVMEITSNDSDEAPFRVALVGTRTATLTAGFATATDTPLSAPYINLTGAEVNLSLSFAPTPGTNLTVIKNTAPPFIDGQFSNLANGATVNLTHNGTTYPFVAWYYGGQGNNDLVLLWPYTGLAAWGSNIRGQLGINSFAWCNTPNGVVQTGVLKGKTIVQVARGGSHSLALCSDGTLAAWGDNFYGQLGGTSSGFAVAPVAVNRTAGTSALAGKTVVAIAAGENHSLALCSDGTVAAWGANYNGQVGIGSTSWGVTSPAAVNTTAGSRALVGKTVVAISAGSYHSLTLCSDGTAVAWGSNSVGQLGDGSSVQRTLPVAVKTKPKTSALAGRTVVALAAGSYHSLALCSDGTVAAWGSNDDGQLGNNSLFDAYSPVAVMAVDAVGVTSALSGKTVKTIAAGGFYSLALCSDGSVAAWGNNENGQLGDNTLTDRPVPVAVNMDSGTSALADKTVVAIAAGAYHSLARCSDGTLAAWGINGSGELGDNSTAQRLAPVAVNTAAGTSVLAGRLVSGVSVSSVASHNLVIYGRTAPPSVSLNTANLFSNATTLTITGTNFDAATPSNNTVVFTPTGTGTVTSATATSLTVSVSGLKEGNLNAVVTTSGQSSGIPVQVATVVTPEIVVLGNGVDISHGDTATSTTNFTGFGNVALVNAQVSHAFTITNQGGAPLNLTGAPLIILSGSGAAAFEVTLAPANAVAIGGSTVFAITFDPTLPGLYTATVTIQSDAANHPDFTFSIQGFGALSKARKQTITFAPPATVYLGQSPLSLSAYSSTGLPVTLSVVYPGTTAAGASIAGNVLSFTGPGTVKVQAVQAGDGLYAAAKTVVKTITVKANPTALTLVNLTQTYTGTPRAISTLGGSGTVTVEYKLGPAFGSTEPTNAGSYPVRATDSKGTKTGTLVIAKAPLYVTPADQRKFVGQDNPPLTMTYDGWLSGDTASVVTTAPALKTTATKASPGGAYPITASGGVVSSNYAFIYQQGVLVVDSFAGSYETLLTDSSSSGPIGKLTLTVTAANTSFTGKLYCKDEKTALSLKGPMVTNPGIGSVAGSASVTSGGIPYVVSITALINGTLYANVTRGGSAYADTSTGRRFLAGQTIPYSGAHTAVLEPATPTANDVPAGAGWATAAISTKGVMTLAGRLGDGTSFTTTLSPDDGSDPTYRLFLQPYKSGSATRLQSYLGGAFTLLPHPVLAGRRYVEAAVLTWTKAGLTTDATYSTGFGPVSTVMMLDPWLPPATGFPLATRLGLTNSSFEVLHSDTGSPLNGSLPTRVGLSTTNAVSVTTPAANTTKWKAKLVPATGLFSGSFELADTTPKPRIVPFTGVLRQPATAPDALIGDGHYLLPPLTGTAKTTGEIMFKRP